MIAERLLIFTGTICWATFVCFGIGWLLDRAAVRAQARERAKRPTLVTRDVVMPNGKTIRVVGPPPLDTFGDEWLRWVNDFPTFKGNR